MSDHDTAERMARMEGALEEIRDAVKVIGSAITDIARLDQKHIETSNAIARTFAILEKLDERIGEIEKQMPIIKLATSWVFRGALAVVGIVGTAVVLLVIVK